MSFSRRLPGILPRPKQCQAPQKYPLRTAHVRSTQLVQSSHSATIGHRFEGTCFLGEKTHDRDHCDNLETKNKTDCETTKIQKNEQIPRASEGNSELRVASGSCGAKASESCLRSPTLGDCFPQTCSSAGPQACRIKITFTLQPTNLNRFASTTTNSMKCLVNWIPLRIRFPSRSNSRNTQPHL